MKKSILFGSSLLLTVFGFHAFPVMGQTTPDCAPMELSSGASACGYAPNMSTATPDDYRTKELLRLQAIDRPLEDDPLGNGLIGVATGGVMGGIKHGVTGAVKDMVGHAVIEGVHEGFNHLVPLNPMTQDEIDNLGL